MSRDSSNDVATAQESPGRATVESIDSLKANQHDDESDDDNERDELFNNLSGGHRSMSIASSDDDTDDFSLRRWRSVLKSGRAQSQDYDYDYLDEDALNRRICFVPGTKVKLAVCVVLAIFVAAMFVPSNNEKTEETKPVARKYKGAPQYVCPAIDGNEVARRRPKDYINDHVFLDYRNNSDLINLVTTNTTYYKDHFRDLEYMNWNRTYNEVKQGMKQWKMSRFQPNLKTGDSIFESGCGIGLSLLLTAELLQEENVRDLHLYGTDFGVSAAATANLLLDAVLLEASNIGGGKRGAVCAADSTMLSFIPDGSFDFVFSSRISAQPDPWEDVFDDDHHAPADVVARRREICSKKGTKGEWKSAALYEAAQEREMAWYGKWVSEMVRIAKPGVPVVIEQVSDPFCDAQVMDEWGGGVSRTFWHDAITHYNWDVDPESLDIESDSLFPDSRRYHVFMRKRHRLVD
jgi:SAM-dependent methyltransferase